MEQSIENSVVVKRLFNHYHIIVTVILLAMFGAVTPASAQFSLGLKVANNYSNIINRTSSRAGFDAGIFMRLGNSFYFQPEAMYSFRSSTLNAAIDELEENFRLVNHYIDVPLLFGYKFINKENFNIRIFIGPRIGFNIANNYDESKYDIGFTQWGGAVGAGIDFWRFTLDVKYDFSANRLYQNDDENKFIHQNIFHVALGFKIFK